MRHSLKRKQPLTLNEREEVREKLEGVGQLLIDRKSKLKSSVKSSDRAGISGAEVMIETASGLSHNLDAEMSEIREKQRNVESQKRNLIEKSLGEVPVPTKKARVCASEPKKASKKKSKKKSNVQTTTAT